MLSLEIVPEILGLAIKHRASGLLALALLG
jgi:hypothetical protein